MFCIPEAMCSEMIAIVGNLPQVVLKSNPLVANALGVFTKRSELVNGAPTYVKDENQDQALWWLAPDYWIIGDVGHSGSGRGRVYLRSSTKRIEDAKGMWWATTGPANGWVQAPDLRVLRHAPPPDEPEVAVVGERTREQRDAEGRKRAIDLNLLDANKRPRTASTELQTRVATARSVCTAAVHKRVEELIRPAVADFVVDKIDEAELGRRKAAARAKAESEHAPLSTLDAAYSKYTAAVAARVAAKDEAEKAMAAEDAAEAELQAAVKSLLSSSSSSEAGPSGVVKAEQ